MFILLAFWKTRKPLMAVLLHTFVLHSLVYYLPLPLSFIIVLTLLYRDCTKADFPCVFEEEQRR